VVYKFDRKKVLAVAVDTHDTLLGNREMPIEGMIPSRTGRTATCLLCATEINDIDKVSSNHGKQGSSAPEQGNASSAVPVVAHVHDRSTPTSRP
jgi:hypothetical protein